jgi:hypothetical protein
VVERDETSVALRHHDVQRATYGPAAPQLQRRAAVEQRPRRQVERVLDDRYDRVSELRREAPLAHHGVEEAQGGSPRTMTHVTECWISWLAEEEVNKTMSSL